MGRQDLNELIKSGPIRIKMNNGDIIDVPSLEFAVVSDYHVTVLVRRDDGSLGIRLASLMNISTVDQVVA